MGQPTAACEPDHIKKWETGKVRRPTRPYRTVLCDLLGATEAELGWSPPMSMPAVDDEAERVRLVLAEPRRVDAATVAYFDRILNARRSAGPATLPRDLLATAVDDVSALLDLRRDASPALRRDILALASQYGQFIGRMAFESGQTATADTWSSRALEWALAAGDAEHAAYVLMRQSSYAADTYDPERVIDLARASQEGPWKLTPGLKSLACRHEAKGHALAGDLSACRRLLGDAEELFDARRAEDEPPYARDHSMSFLQAQIADYDLNLGRVEQAVGGLLSAIPAMPASRHRAFSMARLAHAHADEHDLDAAVKVALEALPMARQTGGTRAVRELQLLRRRLAPVRGTAELNDLLRGRPI
jgi:hypothetical protein